MRRMGSHVARCVFASRALSSSMAQSVAKFHSYPGAIFHSVAQLKPRVRNAYMEAPEKDLVLPGLSDIHATELVTKFQTNQPSNAHDSKKKVVIRSVNKLFDRMRKAAAPLDRDVDSTTLGKPSQCSHLATPARMNLRTLIPFHDPCSKSLGPASLVASSLLSNIGGRSISSFHARAISSGLSSVWSRFLGTIYSRGSHQAILQRPRSHSATSSPNPPSFRVLWIGNSFTYFPEEMGGVPEVLRLLADANGMGQIASTEVLVGGATLDSLADMFEHAAREGSSSGFDMVVLQDHSTVPAGWLLEDGAEEPAEAKAKCLRSLKERYAPILKGMQKRDGTKVLLYQTWGRDADMHGVPEILGGFEELSEKLAEGYQAYGDVLKAEGVRVDIVRVGDAYKRIRKSEGGEEIWNKLCADSNAHPTALAALLIASVFAVELSNLSCFANNTAPTRAAVGVVAQKLGITDHDLDAVCDASGIQ